MEVKDDAFLLLLLLLILPLLAVLLLLLLMEREVSGVCAGCVLAESAEWKEKACIDSR